MNNLFKLVRTKCRKLLKNPKNNNDVLEATSYNYEHLNSRNDAEIKSIDALKYAFKNKKIKNIAITGNYSSGKSTVINSYIKGIKKLKTLKISLATFSNEKKKENVRKKKNVEEISKNKNDEVNSNEFKVYLKDQENGAPESIDKNVEKSIVEKIYYSVYKKIIIQNRCFSMFISLIIYLFIINFIWIIKKNEIYKFMVDMLAKNISLSIVGILFLLLSVCSVLVLSKLFFGLIHLDRFSVKVENFECEFKRDSENVINDNLELLIKIFMRFKYKYVVFEDLDRFESPIIFEHLRELNDILNRNANVKFIYLLRDNIFEDENRTKFFDFIYSVVPYVSYGTSGDVLNNIIKKEGLQKELDPLYIEQIGLFVDDIRILKNTLNEYKIYKNDLNKKNLNSKELFAILIYKNIFSDDFALLQREKGTLYEILNSVEKIKEDSIEKINKKNESITGELDKIELEYKTNENLIKIVVMSILQKSNLDFGITFSNAKKTIILKKTEIDKFLTEIDLEFLSDKDTKINSSLIKIQTIREYMNDKNFDRMLDDFKDGVENRREILEEQLQNNLAKIERIKKQKIKDLYPEIGDFYNYVSQDKIPKEKNSKNLVNFLISFGYINENYEIYISKFHEGGRTRRDNEFLISVTLDRELEIDYKLDFPNEVVKRIKYDQYESSAVINMDLLQELIKEQRERTIKRFFETLRHCDKERIKKFLALMVGILNKELYKYFAKYEDWFLFLEENYDEKDFYIKNICERTVITSPNTLITMHAQERLKSFIEKNNLFLNEGCMNIPNQVRLILESLDIKYVDLSKNKKYLLNNDIFLYCVEENHYEINMKNIGFIVKSYVLKDDLDKVRNIKNRNYSILKENGSVFSYIDNNIKKYLKNVYFNYLAFNDDEVDIIYLLNRSLEDVSFEDKVKIIELESKDYKYKISDLKAIKDSSLYSEILKCDFANVTYENFGEYYDRVINSEENDEQKQKNIGILVDCINRNGKIIDIEIKKYQEFRNFLFGQDLIKDNIYDEIVRAFDVKVVGSTLLEGLSDKKIEILLKCNRIEYNEKNFEEIRKRTNNIFELFVVEHIKDILVNLDNIIFSSKELILIANNQMLHYSFKKKIYSSLVKYNTFNFEKSEVHTILRYIIDKNYNIKFSQKQMTELLETCQNNNMKLEFLNYMFDINKENIDKEFIENILGNSLKEYSRLLKSKARPKYDYSDILEEFIRNLRKLGYNIVTKIDDKMEKIMIRGTVR